LVKLAAMYSDYSNDLIIKETDLDKIGIVKNGKLTVLAIACFLCKKERGILNDSTSNELNKDNLNGLLITNYPKDDLKDKIEHLFDFIVRQLKIIYDQKKTEMKITSYSNFFKNENIYEQTLKNFDGLDEWDKEKLSSYLEVFTLKKDI
jgi:hypothetical protein